MTSPITCCAKGSDYLRELPDDHAEADPGWRHVRAHFRIPDSSLVTYKRVRFCPFCGQSFARLQPSAEPHSRMWAPVLGDFIVLCRDDSDGGGPGPFRIATRKSFPSLREACAYSAGIARGRQPVVAMVYVPENSCQKSTG